MRSGTVARLAGIPAATLRVWERRYAVVSPPKTGTGQRLYTTEDLQRLRLLRQLTQRGHCIGIIANQSLVQLQALAADQTVAAFEPLLQKLDVVAIGTSAAQRLKGMPGCAIRQDFADLDAAENGVAAAADPIDLLFVRLSSLRPESAQRILALRERLRASAVSVLYAFGTEASTEVLRAAGANLQREPISFRELARMMVLPRTPSGLDVSRANHAERRFDDASLAELTELPSAIACECRRHVAEIVMKLAGFERYSRECLVGNPADAQLHRRLFALAESTRGMFELTLEQILAEEALAVPALAKYLETRVEPQHT
jgi:DNA-binding transcriptional MerR regulator